MTVLDDAFVREHEEMVRRCARRVAREINVGDAYDDLVGIGFEALVRAHADYEPERNIPFAGYAYYRVHGAMLYGLQRIGGMSRKTLSRVLRAADDVMEAHGIDRTERDDSAELDQNAIGFEAVFGKITGALICARIAEEQETPETKLALELEKARVRRAVFALKEKERDLLLAIYFEERILDDIAAELGVTRSGASKAHARALGSLRAALGAPS